jgi:hypothetical protein
LDGKLIQSSRNLIWLAVQALRLVLGKILHFVDIASKTFALLLKEIVYLFKVDSASFTGLAMNPSRSSDSSAVSCSMSVCVILFLCNICGEWRG